MKAKHCVDCYEDHDACQCNTCKKDYCRPGELPCCCAVHPKDCTEICPYYERDDAE